MGLKAQAPQVLLCVQTLVEKEMEPKKRENAKHKKCTVFQILFLKKRRKKKKKHPTCPNQKAGKGALYRGSTETSTWAQILGFAVLTGVRDAPRAEKDKQDGGRKRRSVRNKIKRERQMAEEKKGGKWCRRGDSRALPHRAVKVRSPTRGRSRVSCYLRGRGGGFFRSNRPLAEICRLSDR